MNKIYSRFSLFRIRERNIKGDNSSIIGAGTGTMGSRDVITENNREKFLLLIARGHRKLIAL